MRPLLEQRPFSLRACDYTWARRTRHAYRLLVALCILFTFTLWFSEGYLQYDKSETQYRMALTLHPAQARPIMRTVLKRIAEDNETPPSQYVEYLAMVEEEEKQLPAYKQAYALNPRNAFLIINYGCLLYEENRYDEARERFREAGANPPRNALPRYLEAAALAAGMAPTDDMGDLLALLARANASGDPVLFPDPPWQESLPTGGRRHTEMRRDIARQIISPLMLCTQMICDRAEAVFEDRTYQDWDNWLETIQTMGMRLMGMQENDSTPTRPQIIAALEIQQKAAQLRGYISEQLGGERTSELQDAVLRIENALLAIRSYEADYTHQSAYQQARFMLPIRMAFDAFSVFILVYAAGWLLQTVGSSGKSARAIPHTTTGKIISLLGALLMLALLTGLMIVQHGTSVPIWELHALAVWRGLLGFMIVFAILYPFLIVARQRHGENSAARKDDGGEQYSALPLRRYLGFYGCLLRRYMGILTGGLVIVICLWLIVYRIIFSVYPFQMELIASGINAESEMLITEITQYLAAVLY